MTVDDFFALVGKLCLHVVLEIVYAVQDFSGLFQSLIQDLGLGVDVILEVLYLLLQISDKDCLVVKLLLNILEDALFEDVLIIVDHEGDLFQFVLFVVGEFLQFADGGAVGEDLLLKGMD